MKKRKLFHFFEQDADKGL